MNARAADILFYNEIRLDVDVAMDVDVDTKRASRIDKV